MKKPQLSVNDLWAMKCREEDVTELLANMSAEELAVLQNEIRSKLDKAHKDLFTAKKLEREARGENDWSKAT